MLTIRQAQIDTMMQGTKLTAAAVIATSLKKSSLFFQYYTESQLQDWVARQIDYLAQLNIHEKISVEDIIEIISQHGEQFERCPDPSWALSILEDSQESESIRAIMLQRANTAYLKDANRDHKHE